MADDLREEGNRDNKRTVKTLKEEACFLQKWASKKSPHITGHAANARISSTMAWFLSEAEIQI
jgi:hypothetical protein